MHSDQLFSNDLRVKYTTLSSSIPKKAAFDDLKISIDLNQSELKATKDLFHEEKKKNQDLHQQINVYKSKYDEFEKHIRTLEDIIKDKDVLISKLWVEVLEKRKKTTIDEEMFFKGLQLESEISEEGHINNFHQSVGKTVVKDLQINKNNKKIMIQNAEIQKAKQEISDLQESCKVLNERLKEINEIYVKQEIEGHELRDKLKIQIENSAVINKKLEILSIENESLRKMQVSQKNEFEKQVSDFETETKKMQKRYETVIEDLNQEIEELNQRIDKANAEKRKIKEEKLKLASENEELVECLKSTRKNPQNELISVDFSIDQQQDFEKLIKENRELKKKINDIKIFRSNMSEEALLRMFSKSSNEENLLKSLSDTFGEDSASAFRTIQSLLSRYKSKIKDLKSQILCLGKKNAEKIKDLETTQSFQYSSSIDSPKKFISNIENFASSTPTFANEIERYKNKLENEKIKKRRAIAEKEQAKEELAYAILQISELQQENMKNQLEAKHEDLITFIRFQAMSVEKLIADNPKSLKINNFIIH